MAKRITSPLNEGDDASAKREAVLKPRIVREFLEKYNGSALPRNDIALNVLAEMGVPRAKTDDVYALILDCANSVGFLREIKSKQYVDLGSTTRATNSADQPDEQQRLENGTIKTKPEINPLRIASPELSKNHQEPNRRVFITHGNNRDFIEPIKKLLGFGEMTPVVSVESQTVSKPVPDKVVDDMRSCGAAIIHVDAEQVLLDREANEHITVNPNVLIEIGAAMALYGQRFILLVREGVRLPSNLQGLFEVRYNGESLNGETTIRLLEAINDMKKQPMPGAGTA